MAKKSIDSENGTWHGIKKFAWCGYDWIARPLWGDHHPESVYDWYDQDAYEIQKDGTIILKIKDNPRTFINEDGEYVTKPWGVGWVRTTSEFKYGIFEWDMRLPYGKYLWPALWMGSDEMWPPEIDCMEGWSDESPKYIKNLIFVNIKPTTHWGTKENKKMESKNNVLRCYIKGGKEFDHYKVVWTPDSVDIWYNNHKVKSFTNKDMLEQMNKVSMHVIMSTGPYGKFDKAMFDEYTKNGIEMAVRNFKYTPYEIINNGKKPR